MDPVLAWLREPGLECYAHVFADNEVDLEALRLLTDHDLEKIAADRPTQETAQGDR